MFFLSLLYLFFTIVRPQDYMPALHGVPLMPVILGLAFLFWMLSSNKTFAEPQYPLLVTFLVALMMSQVATGWMGGTIEEFRLFGPTVAAFIVLSSAMTSQRRIVITFTLIALCTLVLALHGVQQADTGVGWTGMPLQNGRIRYVGIFNDPNDLGLLFVVAFPMILYLFSRAGLLGRLFWLAGAALVLYAVYLTKSRGTQLAILVIFGVYVWRKRGMVTAGALGVLGLVGLRLVSSRMQDLGPGEQSAFGRVDAWYEGLHMFFSHPLFGVGQGNFTDYNYLTAHNSFVLVLAETGFFGYVTWLAFVGYTFWMMIAMLRHDPEGLGDETALSAEWKEEQAVSLTLLLSLCGFFASAFFLSRSYIVLLYLLAALVVGHYIHARKRFPSLPAFTLGDRGWIWIPIALVSIVMLYVLVTVLLHFS